jgi:hypothetical protein
VDLRRLVQRDILAVNERLSVSSAGRVQRGLFRGARTRRRRASRIRRSYAGRSGRAGGSAAAPAVPPQRHRYHVGAKNMAQGHLPWHGTLSRRHALHSPRSSAKPGLALVMTECQVGGVRICRTAQCGPGRGVRPSRAPAPAVHHPDAADRTWGPTGPQVRRIWRNNTSCPS